MSTAPEIEQGNRVLIRDDTMPHGWAISVVRKPSNHHRALAVIIRLLDALYAPYVKARLPWEIEQAILNLRKAEYAEIIQWLHRSSEE